MGNLRVPIFTAVFDASQATQGPGTLQFSALVFGQKTAAGTGAADTLHRVTNVGDVITLAGRGSMLHRQALAWFASNTSTELWIGLLADDGAGAFAVGTITVDSAATANGTIALYLGGVRIPVGVNDGDAVGTIAASIDAAVLAALDLPVAPTTVAAVTTITSRHKGLVGNGYDIRHSHNDGEALPEGVGLTIVQPVGGTSNPSLTALIAAMGDQWWQVLSHPYTDATSLTDIEQELLSRTGPLRMIDGIAFTSASGSFGVLTALGNGRNSEYSSIVAQPGEFPLTWPPEFAAEVAALVAIEAQAQPNRPMQTVAMTNARSPAQGDLFTLEERDMLLHDGIATSRVQTSVVQLGRIITTYQTDAGGSPDTAYLDIGTGFTLQFLRFDWRSRMTRKYSRALLVGDGEPPGESDSPIISPARGRAEMIAWFGEMQELRLVQNVALFKANLVVEIDTVNPNKLNFLLPPPLIPGLMIGAAIFQFR